MQVLILIFILILTLNYNTVDDYHYYYYYITLFYTLYILYSIEKYSLLCSTLQANSAQHTLHGRMALGASLRRLGGPILTWQF